jgi:hypothetical protein
MLNAFDALDAYISNNKGSDNQNNVPKIGYIKLNRDNLNEYLNLLARQQTVTTQDERSYILALKMTKTLIELLQNTYEIKKL